MTDPHILGPQTAPTPFTADEIRAACHDGHWRLQRVQRGGETSYARTTFEGGDEAGTEMVFVETDASGTPTGQERRTRSTWSELQAHASFPEDVTTVTPERISLEIGERDCLRYDVARAGSEVTFWFAVEHPGMPVRSTRDGDVTETIAMG